MPSSVESSPVRPNPANTIATTATATTVAASAAAAAAVAASREKHPTPIPLIYDSLTFAARQEKWIKDLERKVSVSLTFCQCFLCLRLMALVLAPCVFVFIKKVGRLQKVLCNFLSNSLEF